MPILAERLRPSLDALSTTEEPSDPLNVANPVTVPPKFHRGALNAGPTESQRGGSNVRGIWHTIVALA